MFLRDFKQWSHLLAAVYQSIKRDFLGIMPFECNSELHFSKQMDLLSLKVIDVITLKEINSR